MKKIVGIVSAAAVLASSIFAADVSAGTKIKGDIFKYDGAAESISLFAERNDTHDYANPNFSFSISDDKAGAAVKITTDGGSSVAQTTQTIWFKPVDVLKITLGNYDVALNKETIDWTESATNLGGNGYLLSLNVSGFGLDLGLNQGNEMAYWFTKNKDADPALKEFFVKASYGADFGNIGAFIEFNRADRYTWAGYDGVFGNKDWSTGSCVWQPYGKKADVINSMLFGAGYSNNFNGINAFVNVLGYMGNEFEWVRPEAFVSGNIDAFGFALFGAPTIVVNDNFGTDTQCEIVAKVTYALDGVTPYVYFKDVDILADTFTSTIKLGATGNVGLVGYDVCVQIDTADKITISVPFTLAVNF